MALNVGLVIFGGASLFAVLSSSSSSVIGARAVMGLGAAFAMPATLSILAHVFPPAERPRAIAIWAGFAGMAVAMGGIVSGALLEHFWWGSIFLIVRSLPLDKAGVGSAVNDTTRELGSALGVAVLGSLVASNFRSSFSAAVGGLSTNATHSLAEALQHAHMVGGARGDDIAVAARDAFVTSFDSTLWIATAVMIVASGIVAWLLRPTATEVVEAEETAEERLTAEAA